MKGTLCLIFNIASKYRKAIYQRIDKEYNCVWNFGTNFTDIPEFDVSALKRVTRLTTVRLWGNWYWQKNVVGLIRQYDSFFVLGEPYCLSTWILLLLSKVFKEKKVYLWSHGWYGKETFVRKLVKKCYFHLADGIFLYGHYARKLMIEEGFNPLKLYVIHNSLDYERQISLRKSVCATPIYKKHFHNDFPNLLFIGRLTKVKNLGLLLTALNLLRKNHHSFNLTLVGDGEERHKLEAQVRDLGLDDQVWFYGACYEEVKNVELIYNADLCVSPGNVGLTAIHSMSYGTPVLTHNNFMYQMPEFEAIKEGVTGLFFDYADEKSLANAIIRWFDVNSCCRDSVRNVCYHEIDAFWTPDYQMEVIKRNIR